MTAPDLTDDAILNGRLRLFQPRRGHRFGHDADPARGRRCRQSPASAWRNSARASARRASLCSRAYRTSMPRCSRSIRASARSRSENIARNGFPDRARARDAGRHGAVRRSGRLRSRFHEPAVQRRSPSAIARSRRDGWRMPAVQTCCGDGSTARALRCGDRGSLTLIWRAEGLADVLQALEAGYGTRSRCCRSIRPRTAPPSG